MKRFIIGTSLMLAAIPAVAATSPKFEETFSDSTMRVSYNFCNSPENGTTIYMSQREITPGWAGRRHNLEKLPLLGNGQLYVTDTASGDTIYATSFTALFNEWLVTPEAKTTPRSFEYSFLVPTPQKEADFTVQIIDKYQQPVAKMTHHYDPMDILVRKWNGTPAPYEYLHKGGSPDKAIDVAILGEAYTASDEDQALFRKDAQRVVDAILGHEPFKSNADKFNFVMVPVASADGELSHPRRNEWHDTAFDCHYSTLYSDRYMTTPSSVKAHEILRGIPYEHIILLANTEQYGGGGFYNIITTAAAHHPTMQPVMVHEFGHAFGGLADEYFYPGDQMSDLYVAGIEPWEMNITNLSDFSWKPWSEMLPKDVPCPTSPDDFDKYPVGLYEGGGYMEKGMYRPADKCRMRVNDYPDFCPVCTRALEDLFIFYTE